MTGLPLEMDRLAIVPECERLDTLLVIIAERLSAILAKGEIVPRYYNPGNLFRNVHVLVAAKDDPDPALAQPMVGDAKLTLYSMESGLKLFLTSLAWRPRLMRPWASRAVALARRIRPQLVRCHGNEWNALCASEIKRTLGIPYVLSLHGNPDIDYFRGRRATDWKKRILGRAIEDVEILTVRDADFVIPVYSPIVPYLEKHGVTNFEVVYNSVGHGLAPRQAYGIDRSRVEAICVGRQQSQQKDPSPILEALADLRAVHLTLIGDGDLHATLRDKAQSLGIAERVTFIRNLPNDEVLKRIAAADFMVYSSDNYEISKGCIEAALAGLPIVLNDRGGAPARELAEAPFRLVSGTPESYREAMQRLIEEDASRERLGRAAALYAAAHWRPEAQEARVVEIYRRVAGTGPRCIPGA